MATEPPEHRFAGVQQHALVAVDVAVLTLDGGAVRCLLVQVKEGSFAGQWAFPGGLIRAGESLDEAAEREVFELTGARQSYIEQLYTFGKPERDPGRRVVSTSYLALAPNAGVAASRAARYADVRWFPVDKLPPLAYDHDQVGRMALARLRSKLQYTNIVYSLLPKDFTLSELQEVYETILHRSLDRRNFRKKILALGLLKQLARKRRGTHRPATLYAFKQKRPMVIEMV